MAVFALLERFYADEQSAFEHAMNLKLRNVPAFFAEYQYEPLPAVLTVRELNADQITMKLNRLAKGIVPLNCQHVTLFIDVQGTLLYWVVCAQGDDFPGSCWITAVIRISGDRTSRCRMTGPPRLW